MDVSGDRIAPSYVSNFRPFGRGPTSRSLGDLLKGDLRMETCEVLLLMAKVLHHLGDRNLVNDGIHPQSLT